MQWLRKRPGGLNRGLCCLTLLALCAFSRKALPLEDPVTMHVDFAKPIGAIRPLHGINKGPMAAGGLVQVMQAQRDLALPFLRLHDCHWPNPDVVDIHALFPQPDADPDRAESYDFRLTDEYLDAARATGARIVYRLGESIEHTKTRRYVHPPKDVNRWARVALNIVRHYNDGWANGFHHDIRYWEIWNEPDNRPAMWSGTDEDYFALYAASTKAIKQAFPDIKVGGPAVGNLGELKDGHLLSSPFVTAFLERCHRDHLPLDFFSWHCYTDDPNELALRAREARKLLDTYGFQKTESHLNEWNYLPSKAWDATSAQAAPEKRRAFYQEMSGAPGAAFIIASLIALQQAPVDACCLFHGEVGGFGLFTEEGVPYRNYEALQCFRSLLEAPRAVQVSIPPSASIYGLAGRAESDSKAVVLLSKTSPGPSEITFQMAHLPWRDKTTCEVTMVDAQHGAKDVRRLPLSADGKLFLSLKGATVVLLSLHPEAATGKDK